MIRHDWCFEPFCIILQEWADKKHLFKPAPFEKVLRRDGVLGG